MPKLAEDLDFAGETAFDPREVVLRIPGEHFFCERIDLPESLDEKDLETYLEEEMQRLSPFPLEHLHWAYHHSLEHRKALLFGALSSKLRKLGWENLEIFRRVFPSFVSFLSDEFGGRYERPTISFLMHEGSLTAAAFDSDCPIPAKIYSHALNEDELEEGTVDVTRGKLLSLFDLESYEIDSRILRTGYVSRGKDSFQFEHLDEDFEEPLEKVQLDANALWNQDIRPNVFKEAERKRRKLGHFRWTALLAGCAAVCLFGLMEVGLIFLSDKVEIVAAEDLRGQGKVAEVINLRNVLNKLEQNDRGGIDPFGSLAFVAQGRYKEDPKNPGNQIPVVWFTYVKFPNRGEMVIKG
ncbi:MAG: hypothetical protein AAEJ57_06885, partial [Opitutales bacterium]